MYVHKLLLLLFPCLLFFSRMSAQTDSATPAQHVQDTLSQPPVHHQVIRSDSAVRADSAARAIRRHRRDSLRRDSLRRDTTARHDAAAAGTGVRHDSAAVVAITHRSEGSAFGI